MKSSICYTHCPELIILYRFLNCHRRFVDWNCRKRKSQNYHGWNNSSIIIHR